MRKKNLRKLLRSTRRSLALSEQLVEELRLQIELAESTPERPALGLSEPTWREAQEAGIGYATSDVGNPKDRRIAALERELREAERHLAHHHANGAFTLVRDVNAQTEGQLALSRAEVRRLEARVYELEHPPGEDEPDPVEAQ